MTTQPTLARDPVCGMTVDPAKAKATTEHAGQKYYFCCAGCAQKFQSDPEAYLKPQPMLVTIGGSVTTKPKSIEQILRAVMRHTSLPPRTFAQCVPKFANQNQAPALVA